MNSYKKLVSTTSILAIGTFSSKVLVFLLMPFYTRVLTSADYGTVDLIIQTCNLLIPLASVGVANSVIRFGLDRDVNKKAVFTTGLLTVLCGFGVLCVVSPILSFAGFISNYVFLVLLYVLVSSLHAVCAQYVQAKKYTRLFAIDGVIRTLLTIGLNILFLAVFKMGIMGYVLATVLSDLISIAFLFFMAALHREIDVHSLNRATTMLMLKYSIPLIPTMLCVWIVSISDRYMIYYMVDPSAAGIYAVSYKIPTILSIVAGIFGDAWQISIVSESAEKRRSFFSNIFSTYQCIAVIGASGLIMTAKISTALLASPAYYEAWRCMPILVMGTMFSCLATFLSSIYMIEKKSIYSLITTALAAGSNVLLNLLLIPALGVMGAAIATCSSYFLMFVVRAFHSRKFIAVSWDLKKFLPSVILVVLQAVLMVLEVPFWLPLQIILFCSILALNLRGLLRSLFRVL